MNNEVLEWLANGDTGISSETMAFWLAFGIKKTKYSRCHHPYDIWDFERCETLLNAAPKLRELLPKMKELSEDWGRLVDNWEAISQQPDKNKRQKMIMGISV